MFKPLDNPADFPAMERRTLEFWRENKVFEKSLEDRREAQPFVFYEGPPTANGRPHVGHVLPRAMKDLIPRFQTMEGRLVRRKAGWDTHGLPVELEVEKELGISGKPQIEKYGVEAFVERCRESVFRYKQEWEKVTERIGFWLDLEHPYVTYDNEYIESVWWALKQIWDKGLLYRGYKVVPYCPRCGTSLSSHEVAQGYREVEDPSVFVRFPLAGGRSRARWEGASFLVWTTTPWTLPSNTGLAVNPRETYVLAAVGDERLILAEARLDDALKGPYEVLERFPGEDLVGLRYQPVFDFFLGKGSEGRSPSTGDGPFRVVAADFVSLEDGTGIVHLAPAFGEDDMRVGQASGLPVFQLVDSQGCFTAEVKPWAGRFVKEADPEIIADLHRRGLLYRHELYAHTYPFCWRCDTPLLYYARNSWFIRMSALRDRLLANNEKINWYPEHMKNGRFGNFLENVVDWCLSRERFWGTPLNIWTCSCGHRESVGSIAQLQEMAMPASLPEKLDLHRPYVDLIKLRCPRCGEAMERVPEVIDCWFDSGSMPFAQWHYPFENREEFEEQFPADYICEAIDQTRGWFYSLLAISTILWDRPPFKNVLVTEFGLDDQGRKMSKSKRNYLDIWQALETLGADAIRWYLYVASPPWTPKRFSEKAIAGAWSQTMGTLWNVYSFFVLYGRVDGFNPHEHQLAVRERPALDRWILSRLHSTLGRVRQGLDDYDVTGSARALAEFVDDLSNWYLRRSRRRFWEEGFGSDKLAAYLTLFETLVGLAGALAPFVPFLAEEIYQNLVRSLDLGAPVSVHLCAYPAADENLVDPDLERRMEVLRDFVVLGRAARSRGNLKTRFPLPRVHLMGQGVSDIGDLTDLLLEELNVKEAKVGSTLADVASVQVKPRFDVLGPRLGARMGKVAAVLGRMSGEAALAALEGGGPLRLTIDGEEVVLSADEVDFRVKEKEGYLVESNQRRRVGLDTRSTPELRREGLAREVVNRIQQMRKEAGLELDQWIEAGHVASGELALALAEHGKYVAGETLATGLKPAPLGLSEEAGSDRPRLSVDGSAAWDLVREWTIEGHPLTLAICRAGTPARSTAIQSESTKSESTRLMPAESGESRVAFKLVAGEREVQVETSSMLKDGPPQEGPH